MKASKLPITSIISTELEAINDYAKRYVEENNFTYVHFVTLWERHESHALIMRNEEILKHAEAIVFLKDNNENISEFKYVFDTARLKPLPLFLYGGSQRQKKKRAKLMKMKAKAVN